MCTQVQQCRFLESCEKYTFASHGGPGHVIPGLRRLKQEEQFKASLSYTAKVLISKTEEKKESRMGKKKNCTFTGLSSLDLLSGKEQPLVFEQPQMVLTHSEVWSQSSQ